MRKSRKRTSSNKSKGRRGKKYSLNGPYRRNFGLFNRNPPQGSECRFYHDEYPRQDARRDLANYTSQEYRDFFNMNLNMQNNFLTNERIRNISGADLENVDDPNYFPKEDIFPIVNL